MMDATTAQQIVNALQADYDGFRKNGEWLQYGRCPACGKKELYTSYSNPWKVSCGRQAKCGHEFSTKEHYPHLFKSFSERYQPTEKNPNATADAYMLHARGLDVSKIKGWYTQESFRHPEMEGSGSATVRFYIPTVDTPAGSERTIPYMERLVETVTLIDPETGERTTRKQNFKHSHGGLWWQPPGFVVSDGDTVWITEAIIDAISLNLNGIKAVAILSCGNYPELRLALVKHLDVTWVWALDNDQAGRKFTKRHADRMIESGFANVTAAQPGPPGAKTDWNDLHKQGRFNHADRKNYEYYGQLLLAKSPQEKALLIYNKKNRNNFYFDYKNRLYWFELNLGKFEKEFEALIDGKDISGPDEELQLRNKALIKSNAVHELANCTFTFLYYQQNIITDEAWYYCRVDFPHEAESIKNTFTGGQLSSAGEFKKRLLSIAAGSMFTGTGLQLDKILRRQLHGIKTVQTINFTGYTKEHGCYVFPELAVKDGIVYRLNDEDFFDMAKLSIKTLSHSINLQININREQYKPEWFDLFVKCFGTKGVACLAGFFGSLFAEQIRERHKSFPFLEIVGEPGAGKSTIIEFMWKLIGRRDYEGFDPARASAVGRARNFAQGANLPVVLIESDRTDESGRGKSYDWEELKPLFNGRALRSTGVKNSGNETYEPPFRGSVIISQNATVEASEAVLTRIVHCYFTREHHTRETKGIAEKLERMPMEQVSHFLIDALIKEKEILNYLDTRTSHWERYLLAQPEIKIVRIAKNHAQIMALIECLAMVVPMDQDILNRSVYSVADMAKERQQKVNADHPMIQEFWETFHYLDDQGHQGLPLLNHSSEAGVIAINLNHFAKVAFEYRQQIAPLSELKQHLKNSKRIKYVDQKVISSCIHYSNDKPKTVRCWIFQSR